MFRRKPPSGPDPAAGDVDPRSVDLPDGAVAGDAIDPERAWDLVAVDPHSGEHLDVGVRVTFRDLEVLGSAGRHYAETYRNDQRPPEQVRWRRERAHLVGDALWEAVTDRIGLQAPE